MTVEGPTIESIERELGRLATNAPADLLPSVLAGTGLADRYVEVTSPIGPLFVSFNDRGVSSCVPAADPETFEIAFSERFGRPAVRSDELPRALARRVRRALDTGRLGDLPLDLSSVTPFQRAVLEKTATIPAGQIRPYAWVAKEIGKPAAVRAVGTALATNPIPVLIPCHRVVRTDGRIGNYAFGSAMKRELLEVEGLDPDAIEQLAGKGIRYIGSDTTAVYCHPTCHHAKRITERHRVAFRSETEAAAAGYRACRDCRPAAA